MQRHTSTERSSTQELDQQQSKQELLTQARHSEGVALDLHTVEEHQIKAVGSDTVDMALAVVVGLEAMMDQA